jgi:hypothetical protein
MAWEDKFHTIPGLTAGADLSDEQGFLVKMSSGKVALCGDGERAIGVLRNKPAADGRAAEVQDLGVARVVTGASVSVDDQVASDTNGKAVTAASGDHVIGIALSASDGDTEVISVLLNYQGTA